MSTMTDNSLIKLIECVSDTRTDARSLVYRLIHSGHVIDSDVPGDMGGRLAVARLKQFAVTGARVRLLFHASSMDITTMMAVLEAVDRQWFDEDDLRRILRDELHFDRVHLIERIRDEGGKPNFGVDVPP